MVHQNASKNPADLGGLCLASSGRALWGASQVEVNGSHEGAVAPVGEGRDHQARAVAKILIPVLDLSIHHANGYGRLSWLVRQILQGMQGMYQAMRIAIEDDLSLKAEIYTPVCPCGGSII